MNLFRPDRLDRERRGTLVSVAMDILDIQLSRLSAGTGVRHRHPRGPAGPEVLSAAAHVPGVRAGGPGGAGPAGIIERQLLVSGPVGRSGGHSSGVCRTRLLGVRFWDYSQVRWNLRGRVCLPFSLAWSLLVAAGLPVIQAAIAPALAAVPPTATYAALLVFTADTVVSLQLLRRAGDPAVLSLGNLRAALEAGHGETSMPGFLLRPAGHCSGRWASSQCATSA